VEVDASAGRVVTQLLRPCFSCPVLSLGPGSLLSRWYVTVITTRILTPDGVCVRFKGSAGIGYLVSPSMSSPNTDQVASILNHREPSVCRVKVLLAWTFGVTSPPEQYTKHLCSQSKIIDWPGL